MKVKMSTVKFCCLVNRKLVWQQPFIREYTVNCLDLNDGSLQYNCNTFGKKGTDSIGCLIRPLPPEVWIDKGSKDINSSLLSGAIWWELPDGFVGVRTTKDHCFYLLTLANSFSGRVYCFENLIPQDYVVNDQSPRLDLFAYDFPLQGPYLCWYNPTAIYLWDRSEWLFAAGVEKPMLLNYEVMPIFSGVEFIGLIIVHAREGSLTVDWIPFTSHCMQANKAVSYRASMRALSPRVVITLIHHGEVTDAYNYYIRNHSGYSAWGSFQAVMAGRSVADFATRIQLVFLDITRRTFRQVVSEEVDSLFDPPRQRYHKLAKHELVWFRSAEAYARVFEFGIREVQDENGEAV